MQTLRKHIGLLCLLAMAGTAFAADDSAKMGGKMDSASGMPTVVLSGEQEAPPVTTKGTGKSTIRVGTDKSVSGTVTVSGFTPTASHIHEGAKGTSGPVVVPLTKTSANTFTVPDNAKLTDEQFASYKAGKLYINVHSAAHPDGEIRGQLVSEK